MFYWIICQRINNNISIFNQIVFQILIICVKNRVMQWKTEYSIQKLQFFLSHCGPFVEDDVMIWVQNSLTAIFYHYSHLRQLSSFWQVQHLNSSVYKRIRDIISSKHRKFFVFSNEHHRLVNYWFTFHWLHV